MFARIGMLRALNRHVERVFSQASPISPLVTALDAVQRGTVAKALKGGFRAAGCCPIFQIRTERFILGVLGSLAFGDPISESQATDRSTFCSMPGGRSQAASDAPH